MEKLEEGSILFTDGARAYESLSKELGFRWSSVDHSAGEFRVRVRVREASRGGVASQHLESSVKEFQWRRNLPKDADPFLALLDCIKAGCFQ